MASTDRLMKLNDVGLDRVAVYKARDEHITRLPKSVDAASCLSLRRGIEGRLEEIDLVAHLNAT